MTDAELEKAVRLRDEIRHLESFISSAERVWTGKVIKRTSKYIIKSNPYGALDEAVYVLDTRMKNKVLDVLRNELSDLKTQLSEI